MKILSVLNNKGGVSKTTTSVNLANGLASEGFRVLLIDMDAQGNATKYFIKGFTKMTLKNFNSLKPTTSTFEERVKELDSILHKQNTITKDINTLLNEALDNPGIIHDCIIHAEREGNKLDIIPSLRTELINTADSLTATTRNPFNRLKKALREVRKDYDIVIIDNAPTYNRITINALLVSTDVIIPMPVGIDELEGFLSTTKNLMQFKNDQDHEVRIHILMSMIPRGNRPDFVNYVENISKNWFDMNTFETTIGFQNAVATRASMAGKMIVEGQSNIGNDYRNLVQEIKKGGKF